jgi:hypothetical protein
LSVGYPCKGGVPYERGTPVAPEKQRSGPCRASFSWKPASAFACAPDSSFNEQFKTFFQRDFTRSDACNGFHRSTKTVFVMEFHRSISLKVLFLGGQFQHSLVHLIRKRFFKETSPDLMKRIIGGISPDLIDVMGFERSISLEVFTKFHRSIIDRSAPRFSLLKVFAEAAHLFLRSQLQHSLVHLIRIRSHEER